MSLTHLIGELHRLEEQHTALREQLIQELEAELRKQPEIAGVTRLSDSPRAFVINSASLKTGGARSWLPATYDSKTQYEAVIEVLRTKPWRKALSIISTIVEQGRSNDVRSMHVSRHQGAWFHDEVRAVLKKLLAGADAALQPPPSGPVSPPGELR